MKGPGSSVFRVKLSQKIMYFGFSAFLALIAVAMPILERRDYPLEYQQNFYFLYSIVAFLSTVALFLFLSPLFVVKLVISPEGIGYYDGFTRISVNWTDVERIGKHDFGLRSIEGLILKRPALTYTKWALGTSWLIPLLFGKDFARFINVSLFESNWRGGVIGQEIKKYAPAIAETLPAPEISTSDQAEYRHIGGWLVLVGLWLGLVLFDSGFRLVNYLLPAVLGGTSWLPSGANQTESIRNLTGIIIYLETAAGIAFALISLQLLILFFLKKRLFRPQMLIFLATVWVFTVIDFALLQLLLYRKGLEVGPPGPTMAFQIKNFILFALFLYVAKSSRLKQTFVN